MALPTQIQQEADRAESLEQSLQGQAQVTEPAGQGQPEPDVASEFEKLQSRHASLQGKYNAEVPRLHQQVKAFESQAHQLADENARLREELAKREQETKFLTEQDVETFGEDTVNLVRRGAREEGARFAAEAANLKNQVQQLQAQVTAQAQALAAQRDQDFYRTLTMECPNWAEQNVDQGFLSWLMAPDATYGFQRQQMLQEAMAARDAHKVAAIFNEYARLSAQNPLSRQVTPRHSRSGAEPQPNAPRIWSQREIAAFYDAWRRHQIPDDQAQQIEKSINEAVAAGRITD